MRNVITFTKVCLPYGWLGNMSPHPVTYKDIRYPTAEHLFQALRFSEDHIIQTEIIKHNSPMRAKMMCKPYLNECIIAPRSEKDIENMLMVLLLKIDTHLDLREKLANTNDDIIIEDVTKRPNESGLYWGAAWNGTEWHGTNMLGQCWMSIRSLITGAVK